MRKIKDSCTNETISINNIEENVFLRNKIKERIILDFQNYYLFMFFVFNNNIIFH